MLQLSFENAVAIPASNTPIEFGVDLFIEGKGKKFCCEVEVKTKWFGAEFTFPTLHIALRKRKFMDAP